MLQNEHDISGNFPVGQQRVTPQELTKALAAIEVMKEEAARRQEEEERYLAGTLPIGQAIKDLCLDSTPEEIWAEVQAQRADKEDVQPLEPEPNAVGNIPEDTPEQTEPFHYKSVNWKTQPAPPSSLPWKSIAAVAAPLLGLFAFIGLMSNAGRTPSFTPLHPFVTSTHGQNGLSQGMSPYDRITRTVDDGFYQKLRLCQGPNATYKLMLTDVLLPTESGLQPDEMVYPARAVPDGYSIYDDRPTNYLPFGDPRGRFSPLNGVVFRASSDPMVSDGSGRHLITTRYDGMRYARCWIARRDLDALKHHHSVSFYFCRTGPGIPDETTLVPITVPLFRREHGQFTANFWFRGAVLTVGAPNRFIIPEGQSIFLDKHAWENFPAMTLPPYVPADWAKIPSVFNDAPSSSARPPGRSSLSSEIQTMLEYGSFDASSNVEDIQAVPNNQLFHGDVDTILKLARRPAQGVYGMFPSAPILVDVRPHLNKPYTFVKYNGGVYLRGWTTERLNDQQLQSHVINVSADPDAPLFVHPPVQIQLRLDAAIGAPISSSYSSTGDIIIASDIHTDKYTWAEW